MTARWARWRAGWFAGWAQWLAFGLALLGLAGLSQQALIAPLAEELAQSRQAEPPLKDEFHNKLQQAVSLGPLRERLAALHSSQWLVSGGQPLAELATLAHDHGLQIALLQSGDELHLQGAQALRVARLRLGGSYRQLAGFVQALGGAQIKLALRQLHWQADRPRQLVWLDASVDVYRPLTADELVASAKASAAAVKAAKP